MSLIFISVVVLGIPFVPIMQLTFHLSVKGCCWAAPQSCKLCTCPTSKSKKKPRVSDRDINGLMHWGVFLVQSKVVAIVSALRERRRWPIIGGIEVKLVHQLPGKQEESRGLLMRYQNRVGRKWRRTKKLPDESERGDWKSWLKVQHSEN